jgi:hypothetical protein
LNELAFKVASNIAYRANVELVLGASSGGVYIYIDARSPFYSGESRAIGFQCTAFPPTTAVIWKEYKPDNIGTLPCFTVLESGVKGVTS